jgi:hypothetical protein
MQRRGPLGLHQHLVDGRNLAQAMDLEAAHFERGHTGKNAHLGSVAGHKPFHDQPRRGLLVAGFTAGDDQRGGHALQIPLEGAADGLVEVVDVEDQPAVGGGIGSQVAHVGVAAELDCEAGRGQQPQVGGHHRHRAAKVAEGRLGHEFVLELDERGNAAAHRTGQQIKGGSRPRLGFEAVVLVAAHLPAPRLAQSAPFFRGCPVHDPEDTPACCPAQPRQALRGNPGELHCTVEV